MKYKIISLLQVTLLTFTLMSHAQNIQSNSINTNDEFVAKENNAENPCITAYEYEIIERRCADNIKLLGLDIAGKSMTTVSLGWPLRASVNLTDCSYYHIAAYVDQNTTTGVYQDYNCGNNTYDGHRGTDIATWPFNFYKMDNNLVEVIAAAAGTIIDKHDGEFDRNCSSNNLTANYVVIQHADGSRALYWHMKNGVVTSVAIGQPVVAGDYLGIVGASGSASGPHLHFEVWSGSTVATRIDPYSGTCNTLNATSWWTSQKPYKETSVIRASAHTTDIVLPPCPTTETLNEGASFLIPFQGAGLPAGYAKFYIFIRDEINGMTANLSILNPNNTPYLSWTYTSTADTKVRTWGWSKVLPAISGTYTFQAIYNGITCSSTFDIVNPTGITQEDFHSSVKVYPNPVTSELRIESSMLKVQSVVIYDLVGQEVFGRAFESLNSEFKNVFDVSGLLSGIYFVAVKDEKNNLVTRKIVKM
ncbi:MAG: peptidoglycan DD-metalloendopeptidase family protein [Bacteroidia bacterium]|nr:peptidoglycan DD-metalloendopeptidase family protein [Bacteroidia bacterium]